MVTLTVSTECAANLAHLVRSELNANRYESALHLRVDDDGDQRDELREAASTLESAALALEV